MNSQDFLIDEVTVLLAEDSESDAIFAEQAFSHSKVKVHLHIVKNGEEVIDFLEKKRNHENAPVPDLIILDMHMPRMNGLEALQQIKTNPDIKKIPVIMLSSSESDQDICACYENHANAYMLKAVGFTNMLEFIATLENYWFKKVRLPRI